MFPIGDTLSALAQGDSGVDARELANRRAALEADLATMVRRVLRTGTGLPALVRWVRGAAPAVTGAAPSPAEAERAAPVLARLLCRGLINQTRRAPTGSPAPRHETIVGR
jgi:hypothetical protein